MKKIFMALLVLTFASGAFALELSERDSKDLYMALSKWGTRWADKDERVTRIQVSSVRCIRTIEDADQGTIGCGLRDDLHELDKSRTGKTAMWLASLLARHVGADCNNGTCVTGTPLIRCWHPWDPKHPYPTPIRRHICILGRAR